MGMSPRHHAQARAHDGRRRDRGERAGQGLGVHRAPAGRTRKIGSRLRAGGMSMGLEQQLEMSEKERQQQLDNFQLEMSEKMRSRRRGNRLGILLAVLGLFLFLIGMGSESYYYNAVWVTVTKAVGVALLVCGYPLARLWFWFRAA